MTYCSSLCLLGALTFMTYFERFSGKAHSDILWLDQLINTHCLEWHYLSQITRCLFLIQQALLVCCGVCVCSVPPCFTTETLCIQTCVPRTFGSRSPICSCSANSVPRESRELHVAGAHDPLVQPSALLAICCAVGRVLDAVVYAVGCLHVLCQGRCKCTRDRYAYTNFKKLEARLHSRCD